MTAPQYIVAALIFAAICLAYAATGQDPDPVTMLFAAGLSAIAGLYLA